MTTSHVFDTYATTVKGKILHFDVVLNQHNAELALSYARQWLQSIGEGDAEVSQKTCIYCHSAEAPMALRPDIERQGFAIIKMEGCPL